MLYPGKWCSHWKYGCLLWSGKKNNKRSKQDFVQIMLITFLAIISTLWEWVTWSGILRTSLSLELTIKGSVLAYINIILLLVAWILDLWQISYTFLLIIQLAMLAIGSKDPGEGIKKWGKHSPPMSEYGPVSLPALLKSHVG